MALIHAGGVRFHVQRLDPPGPAAGAPTVVFVHGLIIDNLSSFYYTLAAPAMAAGARVILYDLRGHGRSDITPGHYSTRDAVQDLCALLDALGVTEPVHLVGNSYGGIIAARMAATVPERVAGLVLLEAACSGLEAAAWIEDMANTLSIASLGLENDRVQDHLLAVGERKTARFVIHTDALLNGTSLIDDLAAERPLDPSDLNAIRCPVLGVYGDHSELIGAAEELRRHVPDATVEILPGIAHTVLREATGAIRDLLSRWLSAPVTAGSRG
jgi:pimeloyl-ACP methyl ester carboxylesterase